MTMHRPIAALGCLALALAAIPATAQERLSTSGRPALLQNQLDILDGRAAEQYNSSVRLQPPRAVVPPLEAALPYQGSYDGPYLDMARSAALRHGVPGDLFLRLVQVESGWNAGAVSIKGALGLAQLMPGTADRMGVDATDPYQNLDGGARYLMDQYRAFGTWRLALAAYNAGPEAVRAHGGVPPYAETQGYVAAILGE